MFRGWFGISLCIVAALALFTSAVLYAVDHKPEPAGFLGLEFTSLTPAAAARTPMLDRGGVLISAVVAGSPASQADIRPGEVVGAIDGAAISSAPRAADQVRRGRAGDQVTLTLYDITKGEVRPRDVRLTFGTMPPPGKKLSVEPPRTLAKIPSAPQIAVANAAWSERLLRGAAIRPLQLFGLGDGPCNGYAPQGWRVAGHAPGTLHLMAAEGFAHAIHHSATLEGDAQSFLAAYLEKTFGAPALLSPPQGRPFGFVLRDFGNRKGGAGFVLYRVTGKRIALWLAVVPGSDVSWGKPLVGAVALSMRCAAPQDARPRDKALLATRISLGCIKGVCGETDFAATYLTVLRKGYVHNLKGEMFLVNPRRDFWQSGAEGPGFYRQTGGENERLYPGRINSTVP